MDRRAVARAGRGRADEGGDPGADGAALAFRQSAKIVPGRDSTSGLRALLATGTIDNAVRMGFLTFLPFLLKSRGAGTAGMGFALSLLFVGGAFGKLFCGYLGARIGMMKTVWLTESAAALCIVCAASLPLAALVGLEYL